MNEKGDNRWDAPVPQEIHDRVIKSLSYFFEMENIQIQRKALFAESTHIKFKIFFDGSKQAVGVSVLVQNILPNGEAVTRLLCNKAKLCSDSINTAPRSELTACLSENTTY